MLFRSKTTEQSQTLQTSALDGDSWADELKDKASLFDESLGEFFSKLVPCARPFAGIRPWSDPTDVFAAVPHTKNEIDTYGPIVSISIISPCNFDSYISLAAFWTQ